MGGSFARGQRRRRIGEMLSGGLDRSLEIDRRFFDRFPERRHRVRLATQSEVDGLAVAYGARATRLQAGERWYAVVRWLTDGTWLKVYVPNRAGEECDVPEAWAAALYGRLAARDGGIADLEAATRRVAAIAAERERVKAAVAAGMGQAGGQNPFERFTSASRGTGAGGSTFFRDVNSAAFANLDAWVPTLFGPAAKPSGLGYRVSSADLGRGLEEDLSITGAGAKDFGLHDQGDTKGGSRTAIDLVMEHGGASDAVEAALWLCDRLGIDPAALGWKARGGQRSAGESGNNGAEDDGFGPKATGTGAGANGAKPNGQDKPAVLNDRGVMMGAFRDRLDIALKPEKAPAFPVDALPTLMSDMVAAMADLIQAPDTLCAHSVLSTVAAR